MMEQVDTGPNDRAGQTSRLHWITALVLVGVHVVLAWLSRPAAISTGNDDALYLLLGRSLRSFHYLDAHVLGAPVHAQYPPGYPAFIGLIWSVFGEHFDVVLVGGILVSAIGLLLTFDIARKVIGPSAALLVLAALALNPGLVDFAGRPRSETLYMAATVAAIWYAGRGPRTAKWMVAAGALAIYAAMVRTVGVALVVALIVVWLTERRYRAVVVFTSVAALIVGGWLVWTLLAPDKFASRSYAAAIRPVHSPDTTPGTARVLARRVNSSVRKYLPHAIPVALSVPTIKSTTIDNVFWVTVIVSGLGLGLFVLWRRNRLVTVYLLMYAAILAVWPFSLTRFVIPTVPLLLLTITVGLAEAVRRWGNAAGLVAVAILCIPVTINGVVADGWTLKHARLCRAEPQISHECTTEDQRSFFAAARYAYAETPPNAVFLTVKEATFAYITGRRVQHPEVAIMRDSLDVPAALRRSRIDYILMSPLVPSRLGRFLLPRCTEIGLLREFPPDTYLFRVLPAADSTRGPACEALEKIVANRKYNTSRTAEEQ